jgi:caa(3)-type oxidase subunit IV
MTDTETKDGSPVAPALILHAALGGLLALTAVTYVASTLDLGTEGNLGAGLLIAVVQASLVCGLFMNLHWDKRFYGVVLLVSIGFTGLFVGMTTLDTTENQSSKSQDYAAKTMAEARAANAAVESGAAPVSEEGKQLFATVCAACHGPTGQGVVGLGKNMPQSEFIKGLDDAGLIAFIKKGRAGDDPANTTKVPMPPSGGRLDLTDAQLQTIVDVIRSFK